MQVLSVQVSVYAGVNICRCMQMLMFADAGVSEGMYKNLTFIYLKKLSEFETTGYRKLELNIWGLTAIVLKFLSFRAVQPYRLVPVIDVSKYRSAAHDCLTF